MDKVLSIVIPVWNKSHFTKACLQDLGKLPDDHEIVLIDNGSTDDTNEIVLKMAELPELYYKMAYKNTGVNLGFAKACNIGYGMSTAPNVLFLNNDIRVRSNHTDWTKSLLEHCATSLVGPTMGQLDNDLNFVQEDNKELPGKSYMSGWCLASSKENFDKLRVVRDPLLIHEHGDYTVRPPPQIFSEEFGLAYFEDTDLSFRARQLGIPFKVIEVPVVHFGKQTSVQLNVHKLYNAARQIFVKKWSK
jgi:GT2 family glycosyltransferase